MPSAQLQVPTVPVATARGDAWDTLGDAVVSSGVSLTGMALKLGRTYYAVESRRRALGLARREEHAQREVATLCPCASLDGEHESWCPNA